MYLLLIFEGIALVFRNNRHLHGRAGFYSSRFAGFSVRCLSLYSHNFSNLLAS